MARQTNAAYWAQRLKNMEGALLDQSFGYVENMERQFAMAQAEVERQIAVWYQRFAANNEVTLADAKRLLTAGELAEFRWTVGEYIAYGQQNAIDGVWMRQLENASARVHITRLEALKLQIQQQAEALYSNQLDLVDAAAREMYLGSYYGTAFELQRGLGVGWTMQALNEGTVKKVLSRPWTLDGQTFRDRCWTNKQALVNSVNTQLTQMIIRGEAPDRAITAVAKQFNVSKSKAGRLIMTESAYFASAAQKDCYGELGVERYKIVASFDQDTCELCGALDGQVFKMSEYQPGLTAPPFHPWCRCCTAPYFEDMEGLGERWSRNPDGSTEKVPADMTFEEWKQQYVKPARTDVQTHKTGLTAKAKRSTINLSDAEQRAVNEYVSSGSYKINAPLRTGMQLTEEQQAMVAALDSALEKMPVYKGTVYRSLDSSMMDLVEFWKKHEAGKNVIYPAYTSASISIYDETMDIQMVIQAQTGRDIRSWNPGEQEILFSRNTEFRIIRVDGNTVFMEEV